MNYLLLTYIYNPLIQFTYTSQLHFMNTLKRQKYMLSIYTTSVPHVVLWIYIESHRISILTSTLWGDTVIFLILQWRKVRCQNSKKSPGLFLSGKCTQPGPSLVGSLVKNPPANAGDVSSISGSGRLPGEGDSIPLRFLPGKSHGQRSRAGYSPWGCKRVGHNWATKPPPPSPPN